MTPIKSLPTIKRPLEKAFTCKSHFMTMIHSEWCVLLFTCLLWHEPAIYFGVKRGGLAKTEKNKTKQEKKEIRKEAWESVYASLTYFWDLYDGNVRKEILILFNPIRMKSVE